MAAALLVALLLVSGPIAAQAMGTMAPAAGLRLAHRCSHAGRLAGGAGFWRGRALRGPGGGAAGGA
ncbi:MAG: hypothetical protein IPG96_06740 [Proteobacteria bacterium]|nr:hypothetical protein [Pseudomonadota bacterium]